MTGIAMLNSSFGGAAPAVLVMNLDAASQGAVPGASITTSASFDGSSQYLTLPASTDWALGTGDFTIEWWQYQTSVGSGTYPRVFSVGNYPSISIGVSIESGTFYVWEANSFRFSSILSNYLNQWVHFAISRVSGQTSVYQNGTRLGSAYSDTNNINDSSTVLAIGAESGGTATTYFPGYLSNFRIIKGTGLYSGVSLTVPTSTLRAVSGTVVLLPLAAAPFMDMSINVYTITNTGTTTTTASAPALTAAATDVTGTYALTTVNAGSLSWATTNGGIFSKSNNTGTDVIFGGPNYVTGQSYSVFMAYQRTATATGRLLNTQSEASKDWLMGLYNGNPDTFYPNFSVNLPGSGADLVWHFGWATWNTGTSRGQLYTATSTQPTSVAFTAVNGGGGGFNQLRLFSRSGGSEVQSGNIGMIRVYNGVLTLAEVQSLYAKYKARFGY
jgi:hypothetical protein